MPSPTMKPLNILLSQSDRLALTRISHHLHVPLAQVIRMSIRSFDAHLCQSRPTCANGHPCQAPHLAYAHIAPNPPAQPTDASQAPTEVPQ